MANLADLTDAISKGRRLDATRLATELVDAGIPPGSIIEDGLVPGMTIVGERFRCNEIFVPEMLIAARAMKEVLAVLEPHLVKAGSKPKYTAIIGTVQGDLHDIGKNLVSMMWRGANFQVIDLGTNVSSERFVAAAHEHSANVIGVSALLTTTMPAMRETVRQLRSAGVGSARILVGGAPITKEFAEEIGADAYAADAGTAMELAMQFVGAPNQG